MMGTREVEATGFFLVFCLAIFEREKNIEKESRERERDLNPIPRLLGRHSFLGCLEFSDLWIL
ncbi:hypothetical protein OIU78_006429 [Salix suchowensis]|nr:hypothetical protein OIU78_006429 [Salix suchowensis]